jgi:hypothetical protein
VRRTSALSFGECFWLANRSVSWVLDAASLALRLVTWRGVSWCTIIRQLLPVTWSVLRAGTRTSC